MTSLSYRAPAVPSAAPAAAVLGAGRGVLPLDGLSPQQERGRWQLQAGGQPTQAAVAGIALPRLDVRDPPLMQLGPQRQLLLGQTELSPPLFHGSTERTLKNRRRGHPGSLSAHEASHNDIRVDFQDDVRVGRPELAPAREPESQQNLRRQMTSGSKGDPVIKRNVILAVGLAIAMGVLCATASATIVVGQSIAGVKLGDTMAQVLKAVGKPSWKEHFTTGPSKGQTNWSYEHGFDGIIGFNRAGRVNGMWTASPNQSTSTGIHPGNDAKNMHGAVLARVKKTYPTATCDVGALGPQSEVCNVRSTYRGRAVITAFVFRYKQNGLSEVDFGYA